MPPSRKDRGPLVVFSLLALSTAFFTTGCGGGSVGASQGPLASAPANSPSPTSAAQLSIAPASISLSTALGVITFQNVTASNAGNATLTVSQAKISGAGFGLSGLTVPSSLAAGQSQTFHVTFAASTAGIVTGTLTLMTDASANPMIVPLRANAAPLVSSVTISPAAPSVVVSTTLPFTAAVQGSTTNTSVTWKATLGTVTTAGIYTAPSTAGTDTVSATSVADPTQSASATVTVSAPTPVVNSVAVSPASTSTTPGGTLQFASAISGTAASKSVTWKAAFGTISAGGVYTAPSKPGTDTVTATSDADSTKSATATVTVSSPNNGPLPAFPGAQGGGAAAVGGRGGQVIEVTNLNDSGSGSLRACLEASGPRTCIFRVAGIITPASQLKVQNPFLTIACQTAPGEIIIGGPRISGEALFISTHDVIVRYCTFSADNIDVSAGPDTGTMNIEIANGDNYNIVFDHITTRWAGNKLWLALSNYVGPNHLITTQWSLFYEPHADHPVGPGTGTNPGCTATSSSACFSSSEHDIDFHHNLFANMSHRIPESVNYSTRWINNIVFNWEFYASAWLGAMHVDEIGNKYVPGNMNSGAQKHEIHFTSTSSSLPGDPSVYLADNIGPNRPDPSGDQYAMANQIGGENGSEQGPLPSSWIRISPMADTAYPIVVDAVTNLDAILMPTVGNSQHLDCTGNWVSHRDSADTRIVNQYKNGGPGGFWPNGVIIAGTSPVPTPSAEWTDQPVTNFSSCTESQHDGIPDDWKSAQGLSTTDSNLYKEVAPNGYTYLENYINGPNGSASLTKPYASGSTWSAIHPSPQTSTPTNPSQAGLAFGVTARRPTHGL
jgi:pectate lyase